MEGKNENNWLSKIKEAANEYKEPLPDDFWNTLKKDIPFAAQHGASANGIKNFTADETKNTSAKELQKSSANGGSAKKPARMIYYLSSAAAVVLLLVTVLLNLQKNENAIDGIAVKTPTSISENNNAIAQDSKPNPIAQTPEPAQTSKTSQTAQTSGLANEVSSLKNIEKSAEFSNNEKSSGLETKSNEGNLNEEKTIKSEETKTNGLNEGKAIKTDADKANGLNEEKTIKSEDNKISMEQYLLMENDLVSKAKRKKYLALSAGNQIGSAVNKSNGGIMSNPNIQSSSAEPYRGATELCYSSLIGNSSLSHGVASQLNEDYKYSHKQPFKLGIGFAVDLGKGFNVETGVLYQNLKSRVSYLSNNFNQSLHYLGFPIKLNWNFVDKKFYSVYAGAGFVFEKCIYATVNNKKVSINDWQKSINVSSGVQFKLFESVALYLEPGFSYYMGVGNGVLAVDDNNQCIKSIYSQNPWGFSLQGGFRFLF